MATSVTIYNAANTTLLPLGTIRLQRTDYTTATVNFTNSSMTLVGGVVTITLGTPSGADTTAAGTATMRWTPSATATDLAGNTSSTTSFNETGTADVDLSRASPHGSDLPARSRYDGFQPMRTRARRRPWTAALLLALLAASACDAASAGAPSLSPGPQTAQAAAAQQGALVVPHDRCDVSAAEQGSTVVDIIRQPDGSCLAPSHALLYRCDPVRLDPLLSMRRGGSTPTATSAAPMPLRSPRSPTMCGRSASRRWAGCSSARISGASTSRPAAGSSAGLAHSNRIARPPTASMIGDSIMDGGKDAIVAGLPDWTVGVDALIGRGFRRRRDGGRVDSRSHSPDVVLVELGVNDADPGVFAANAQRILAAVGEADLVVWVTAHGPELAVPGMEARSWPRWARSRTERSWTGTDCPPGCALERRRASRARTGGAAGELRHAVPRVVDARRHRPGRDACEGDIAAAVSAASG